MDHSNLGNISQNKTKTAMESNPSKSKSKKRTCVEINEGQRDESRPNKRLSNIDISNFLVENNIKEKNCTVLQKVSQIYIIL